MDNPSQELTISQPGALEKQKRVANTIFFPKELREAIPSHSGRLLEFDRVTGKPGSWATVKYNQGWLSAQGYAVGPRARLSLLAHETGKLKGEFEIGVDLDTETMRALGQFLIQLADSTDRQGS